jgi:hypothetical protein
MTIFRVYYATRGAHVHCRVFAGEGESLMPCGKLVMRVEEFKTFASESGPPWHFIPEATRDGESTVEFTVATWLSLPTAMRTKERLLESLNQ